MVSSYGKLKQEIDVLDDELAGRICVDDWSIKDLLAVRLWWTESVCDWIETGCAGATPVTPAPDFSWRETPALNASIVAQSRNTPLNDICAGLDDGFARALSTVHALDDKQLLNRHEFEWAGKLPIARWLSINTTRQYVTARSYIRRAVSRGDET